MKKGGYHGCNCFVYALRSFPTPKFALFFWQWGISPLHQCGRFSFEWLARKRRDHQSFYWTILSHSSGWYFTEVEEWAGYNSPRSSHCDFLSFQANWQMHIDFSQCMFTAALSEKKSLQPNPDWISSVSPKYTWGSYVMCRRSGQANTHCFWTRSLWVYRLWQVPVSRLP